MALSIGENVGAYRIVAQLGQGGMASVYKAYHPGLDRYVAMKVLHPAFKEDPSFVHRFNREAKIVARMEHPNIVPVFDFAEHRGLAYLVMRFVEGETLKARLKRGLLTPIQIIEIAKKIGAALSYAHSQGILHRDIKPSNVLIADVKDHDDNDAIGEVYLTDFGLARIAEAGESTMSRDMMMGTPQYISPEQAKGTRELDEGTDIYSLGVVLFEMVTGRVPFSADTPYSIIHDHIFTPLPLPSSINPDIPDSVERVLLKSLAKERQDRYTDVDQFINVFVEALEPGLVAEIEASDETTVESPPAISEPISPILEQEKEDQIEKEPKEQKRRKTWLYLAIGAAVLLCACSGLFIAGKVIGQSQANATATAEALVKEPGIPLPKDPVPVEKIAAAEERVQQHPDDPFAKMDLGLLYLENGDKREAEDQLLQAIEMRPEDEGFYLEIGHRLIDAGEQKWAAEVFLIGLEVLPESRELIIQMTKLLWIMGQPGQNPQMAEDFSNRLIEVAPDRVLPHVLLANALMGQDRMEEARVEVDIILDMAPDSAEAHLVNGIWLRRDHQFLLARREFQLALELGIGEEWIRVEVERELEKTEP